MNDPHGVFVVPAGRIPVAHPLRSRFHLSWQGVWSDQSSPRLLPFLHQLISSGVSGTAFRTTVGSDCFIEPAIDLIHEGHLAVSSLGWIGGVTGDHDYSFEDSVREGFDQIHLASRLQAKSVLFYTGSGYGHINKHRKRVACDALQTLADAANPLGIRIALQAFPARSGRQHSFLRTIQEAAELLEMRRDHGACLAIDLSQLQFDPSALDLLPELSSKIGAASFTLAPEISDLTGQAIRTMLGAGYQGSFDLQASPSLPTEYLWREFVNLASPVSEMSTIVKSVC